MIERVKANIKWYNPHKGYGFLIHPNDSTDIMIHFSALDAVACPYVKEGDQVICEIVPRKLGWQVVRVIEVQFATPEPRSLSTFSSLQSALQNLEDLEDVRGTVKWYNPDKGYGFIRPEDESQDIFLHFSVLREAGHKVLKPGCLVLVKVFRSERGPEAHKLRVLVEEEKMKDVG